MNKVSEHGIKFGSMMDGLVQDPLLPGIVIHTHENNNGQPQINEMRKVIKQLQVLLQEEKEMRLQAQQNLRIFQKRAIVREKQFHSILELNNKQVKMFKTGQSQIQCIKKTYQDIYKNFEKNNDAMNKLIEKKYKQNLSAMERRVASILEVFHLEVSKNKKVSHESIKQIKALIQKALSIVESVEDQNIELRINLKNQRYRTKLMHEQRRLLLQEIADRKQKMLKLINENNKYRQIINQQTSIKLSKDNDDKQNRTMSRIKENEDINTNEVNSNQKYNTLLSTLYQFDSKQLMKYSNSKLVSEMAAGQENPVIHNQDCSGEVSRQSSISGVPTKKLVKNSGNAHYPEIGSQKNQVRFSNKSKKYSMKNQCKNSIDFSSKQATQCLVPFPKSHTASFNQCSQPDKIYNEKIIQHLKCCLERQKKKVTELGKIVARFQARNQEVNQAILQALTKTKEKQGCNSNNSLEGLLKSQKLFEVLGDMKKRLAMCEKPTVGCGWGEPQLELLLQQ